MQEKGVYIGSIPLYGYKKSKADRHILEIDEYSANVVKDIFAMYLDGKRLCEIAKYLNEKNILIPKLYARLNYKIRKVPKQINWTTSGVRYILTNCSYTGKLEQHRTEMAFYLEKPVTVVPKECRLFAEIPQIIDDKTFNCVQQKIRRKAAKI